MTRGMGGHSPANVSHYLKGASFPATKRDLAQLAKTNGADEDVFDTIANLPEENFGSMADVMKAYGEVKH